MSQEEAFKQLMEFMGSNPIVSAHSMPFDGGILKTYSEKFGMEYKPSGEIDTLVLARKVINGGNGAHKLVNVATRYDLAGPDTDWHDASVDVAVLPGILDNLLDEMATTNSGVDTLDINKSEIDFNAANEQYFKAKDKESTAETELIVVKPFADGMAGKDVPTPDDLINSVKKDLPNSEELSPDITPNPSEVSDGDNQIESIFGGLISNNWVTDNENTSNIGLVLNKDLKPGDFISGQLGGYHEVISVEQDPDDEKRVIVTRRLLANGKVYSSSRNKFQKYETRRRNELIEFAETPETPEVEQPILETDEAPEKESSAGTWNGYKVSQGTDGIYYAENISASDVQALRNGELTPPQLPFFAPLGGGNDQETGEGYFFSANGKRFWGKYGAAGALVRRKNSDGVYEYFLAKRSSGLSQGGGKWGYPGGAHKDQTIAKSIDATAKEEFSEEVGGDLSSLTPISTHQNFVGPEWSYDTYVYEVGPKQLSDLAPKDGENSEIGWFTADQINQMAADGQLHSDFANSAQDIFDMSEDNTKGPAKPTPADSKATEVKAFDTTKWKKIGGQAGSNDGAFYVDPDTGNQYYVKKPKSDKHAANEALASALYAEAGTKIGRVYLGKDSKGNTVLVSPLVENSKKDFSDKKTDSNILKSAQEDFAVDAWLNNYDSVGLAYDNMLTVDEDVYRVDPGGSLLFRAQGKDKSGELTDDVKSIDSLRDGSINSESNDIFGSMTDEQIAESAKKVQAISPEKIDQLVDQAFPDDLETASFLKEKLKARREDLIKRFGLEPQAEEAPEPVQSVSDTNPATPIDPSGDVAQQLNDSVGKKVSFLYGGKDRVATVLPSKEGTAQIVENPKTGKVNVLLLDSDGKIKNFTIAKMEANSEGFEAPKEAPKPSTEAPEGWVKEGNYTWKKDGWVVTEDTDGKLTASNSKVPGLIFGDSFDEILQKSTNDLVEAPKESPSIPKVATPEEIKAIAESPDGGITPSANDDITPVNPEPEANPTPADKPTEVPAAAKKKLLDDLSNLAEQVFGKAPSKDALKSLLNSLKEQGGDSDLIDSVVSDIDGPKPLETPSEKIAEDIAQDLTPESDGGELATPAPLGSDSLSEILSNPDETNPELIWNQVKQDYEGSVLDSGHIVVHSVKHGDVQYDVVVRRNEDNSFSVYHRITNPDGSTKAYVLVKKNHSAKALKNSISAQIYNANYRPNRVKKMSKAETAKTLLPTSFAQVPTEMESYVAADGTVLKKCDMIKNIKPKHKKFGQTGKVVQLIRVYDSTGYGYTDYVRVKWQDGEKNKIVSKSVVPIDSDFKWGDTPSTPPSKPTPSTPSSPSAPSAPAVDTTPTEISTYDAPSLGGAKALKDVEALSTAKNSSEHMSYFGADSYSDYKEFLKGDFVKDPESKNLVPGIIVQNASPNSGDEDLTSYGVVTSTKPSVEQAGKKMTTPEVTVSYFDGPLAGKSVTLTNDKVWSREKFLTNEQSKELGIDVDTTLLEKSRAASKAKGEKYAKEMALKKKKQQQENAEKAIKAQSMDSGPGFEKIQAETTSVNWNYSALESVPTLTAALRKVNGDNPVASTNGVAILGDADQIEDLAVKVQKVVGKDGKEKIRLTFKMTTWSGNDLVQEIDAKAGVSKTKALEMPMWDKQSDGLLKEGDMWNVGPEDSLDRTIDRFKNGTTYKGKAGKGDFRLHRATKELDDDNVDFTKHYSDSKYTVSMHNMVEISLPADATEQDIQEALKQFGIKESRPSTPADIKGMVENKMIWMFGKNTNGKKNIKNELRLQKLQQIQEEWGFTADDVEIKQNPTATGGIDYLIPESVAASIADKVGIKYFTHSTTGKQYPSTLEGRVDLLYDTIVSGGLYSTAVRWSNGINMGGMSSSEDLRANGGNYMFTNKAQSPVTHTDGSKPVYSFDAVSLLRKMGYYSTGGDSYGQLKGSEIDIVDNLKSAGGQIMFKKNLTWADLAYIDVDPKIRQLLIDKLTQNNNQVIGGVDIVDILSKGKKGQ
jgi:8-oxo-dGTP diphosphatase